MNSLTGFRQAETEKKRPFPFLQLPFMLIVATARLANPNVDLFIRGHKKRLHPYWVEPLINLPDLLCGLDAYYRAFL